MNHDLVLTRVKEVLELAAKRYPLFAKYIPTIKIEVPVNMGKTLGQASATWIKISLTHAKNDWAFCRDETIPHEVAHTVCACLGIGYGHDSGWKRVAYSLGCRNPRAIVNGVTTEKLRKRLQFQHKATCGSVQWLGDVRHNRLMKNCWMSYTLLTTGGKITRETFTGITRRV